MSKELKMSFDNKIWNVDLEHNKSMEFIIFDDVGGYKKVRIDFKIIEKQQDIDIQAIEELDEESAYPEDGLNYGWSINEKALVSKINQILLAIKKLDRK